MGDFKFKPGDVLRGKEPCSTPDWRRQVLATKSTLGGQEYETVGYYEGDVARCPADLMGLAYIEGNYELAPPPPKKVTVELVGPTGNVETTVGLFEPVPDRYLVALPLARYGDVGYAVYERALGTLRYLFVGVGS